MKRLRAIRKRMPSFPTIITQFLIHGLVILVRTILEAVPTPPTKQTYLQTSHQHITPPTLRLHPKKEGRGREKK